MDASSLVLTPTPPNTTADASNSVDDVDINVALTNEPPAIVNNAPVSAPDAPPQQQQPSTATPSSTPHPSPPSPNVATPSPQPDPSPAVPPPSPSVSPPPAPTPVSPKPPPAKQTPPPLPPKPSPPPPTRTPSPPPPTTNELPPPPTSKVSPSPPPPQAVILSPPPPVNPPPPPATVAPPSLYVPPSPSPSLPPNNSSAPSSNSSTPIIPTPMSPSPSTTPPAGRNQYTDSPSTAPSSTYSDDSSSSSTSHDSSSSGDNLHVAAVVGGSVAAVVALAFLALVLFIMKKRKKRRKGSNSEHIPPPNTMASNPDARASKPPGSTSPGESSYGPLGYRPGMPESGGSKSWFTYEELKDITAGFSQENLLGQGGFGCVYKGRLPDGRTVAVKQLKVGGGQGDREFRAEVEIISRVHHRHLVSLVGYCISENDQLLVYEYVPNKTLEYHLHAKGLQVMEWSKRVKIAIGSARGLAYLHEDCHPRIIHRDIKSANILLDDCFEAQVADFGLAKLTNDANTHVSTRVMGTFGYMAPEYASSGKLTDRSDVFSFGVVLLELITGRKPVDSSQPLGEESLVEWARPVLVHTLETGDCEELVDPRLDNNFSKSEMMMMIEAAAACVRHSASKRPRMVQVVRALDSMSDMTDLSNGVRYGESTVFNSRQYSEEIRRFQRAAFASGEFGSDLGTSGEHERRISIFSGEDPNIP